MNKVVQMVHKTIFAIKPQNQELDFILVLADPKLKHQDGEGKIIEQSASKLYYPDIVFDGTSNVIIKRENILQTIEVQCREQNGLYIIPKEEYKRISFQIANDPESSESSISRQDKQNSQQSSSQEEDFELQAPLNTIGVVRKRGRPKGSKNKKKYGQQSESEQQDEFDEEQKRGRGRPKGSKNKKNLLKKLNQDESKETFELKVLMTGYLKRGKGRPKGSKNKPKRKQQNIEAILKEDSNFWKRGKGRPKGSKNKIKNNEKQKQRQQRLFMNAQQEAKQKRNRGRPKGVKNKPRSQPSIEQQSENNEMGTYLTDLPQYDTFENVECCSRCNTRGWKQALLKCEDVKQVGSILEQNQIYNLAQNFSMENRTNLFIVAIKQSNTQMLKLLIQKNVNKTQYFKCMWKVDGKIQATQYTIKTHKQALSRSGKEGNYVLLHDYYSKRNQVWWRQIGIQRILNSINNQAQQSFINFLKSYDADLVKQIYCNIPILIRSGNHNVAKYLLNQMSYNEIEYSNQHYQCLSTDLQQQYKKMNIIRKNTGLNYCSPIHCASINPNYEILQNIVKNFPNHNVADSIGRKPIHYAAACIYHYNLEVLLKYGSDLKDLDKMKMTPLMIAAYYGRVDNVKYIMEKFNEYLYLNFKSEEGYTALHYAVLNNHLDCVSVLAKNIQVDINAQTPEKQTAVHMACGSGHLEILIELISRYAYIDYYDLYKRTPLMYAIRNNNFNVFTYLMTENVKFYKCDSSLNSMLHYAAAYGNYRVIVYLLMSGLKQTKNKRKIYPWQIALIKGHLGCAKKLQLESTVEQNNFAFEQNILFDMIKNMRGTDQHIQIIRYLIQSNKYDMDEVDSNNFTYLHYCCNINEEDYIKCGIKQRPQMHFKQLREQYRNMQFQVIQLLIEYGNNKYRQNKNKETPLNLCIQNGNIIGIQQLIDEKINLQYYTSNGNSILYYLSTLASIGSSQCTFVLNKLMKQDKYQLKNALKRVDFNGFQPLLYFVKDFTFNIKQNFHDSVQKKIKEALKTKNHIQRDQQVSINKIAFNQFQAHQNQFIKLITYLVDQGSDSNVTVANKGNDQSAESLRKWGIQHFLMKFPSLKILKFFKGKIKDFNAINNQSMTPLHLFCRQIKKGNLLEAEGNFEQYKQYQGEKCLQFLLDMGANPNIVDQTKSTPLLYAALNKQISFMVLLKKHGANINTCNSKNQVPLIEVIKMKDNFNFSEIQSILKSGADPNFQDFQKRNSLHHLVYNSKNFDSSPQVCKILFDYKVKINGLDKFNRTPIFYCFTEIDPQHQQIENQIINDKVEIVQTLINHKEINLDHVDNYGRTVIHYACQKDYFFSILYLLDKNIDITHVDNEGNTPLAICLKSKNLNQAALLIKKGVQTGFVIEGDQKLSYFSYAMTRLSVGICYMLLDYGYPIENALEQVNNAAFKKVLIKKYKEQR